MYFSYHFSNLTHGVVIGVKQSCFHLFLEINLSILQYLVQYLKTLAIKADCFLTVNIFVN